jgi:hypothetical protein
MFSNIYDMIIILKFYNHFLIINILLYEYTVQYVFDYLIHKTRVYIIIIKMKNKHKL